MMMTMENSCKCYDDEHCQRRTQQQQIPHGTRKTEEQTERIYAVQAVYTLS